MGKETETTEMKINFQSREVEAKEVDILISNERWNEYQLSDGNILMYKDVLVSVLKVVGETTPDGGPIYHFQTHRVVRVKSKEVIKEAYAN